MKLMKTDKETFTPDEILSIIADYEMKEVPFLDKLWEYYLGNNTKILSRKQTDANNPNNKIPIPYARKIVNTFVGYAYRPRYISYSANVETDQSLDIDSEDIDKIEKQLTVEEKYVNQLKETFNKNNEHIKTSRAGRNDGIFGVAYELLYTDGTFDPLSKELPVKAEVKFFSVDPREMILFYDYSPEPKKNIAIHFYRVNANWYKVEVYYKDRIETYDRKRKDGSGFQSKWELTDKKTYINYFDDVPVAPYYFGDEMVGVIKPVLDLIDAYDVLYSDSMNEFEKFAAAYMVMKKYGITDPVKMKDPATFSTALANLKKSRIFEHLPTDAEISFLTKDIPTGFIQFMSGLIRDQMHIQSHVPDFTSDKMAGASGRAIKRLLFDFENLVSSNDADFDLGLIERIRLMTIIYGKIGLPIGTSDDFSIVHKRNLPDDTLENAQVAQTLKNSGMSSYLATSALGSELCPDVQAELARQKKEQEDLIGQQNFGFDPNSQEEEISPEDQGAIQEGGI